MPRTLVPVGRTQPPPPPKVYQQKSTGPSPAFSVRNQVECRALQQPGLLPGLTLKTTGHRWPVWPGSAETLRPLRSWCLCRKVVLLESLWLGWLTTRGLHLRCVPIGHALRFLGLILTSSQLSSIQDRMDVVISMGLSQHNNCFFAGATHKPDCASKNM